jgi:hypothetical protein
VLDAGDIFGCIVCNMKMTIFAVLAGAALIATGCVKTVSDTHSFASTWGQDTITARYPRTMDQVYQAAVRVVVNNGVLTREYITPGTNVVRSLEGKVNQKNIWIRVQGVDAHTTQVDVQARSSWGVSDVSLSSELNTEIALQLAR